MLCVALVSFRITEFSTVEEDGICSDVMSCNLDFRGSPWSERTEYQLGFR